MRIKSQREREKKEESKLCEPNDRNTYDRVNKARRRCGDRCAIEIDGGA